MGTALKNQDFDTLQRLGHGFKGATITYGLNALSAFFLKIENAAKDHDNGTVVKAMEQITEYISNVEIEYIYN
jgi:HPt (histidine-containing phosphotransfer) domain-containing protein